MSRNKHEQQLLAHREADRAERQDAVSLAGMAWFYKSREERTRERNETNLEIWQHEWDRANKGRTLYRHYGNVGLELVRTTFKATTYWTWEHGDYLHRRTMYVWTGKRVSGTHYEKVPAQEKNSQGENNG